MKWNVPNILTMIRLFCTPIVAVLFLVDIPFGIGVLVALGVYILACITDFLDGYIARKYNLITDFGKFMDQIADKAITTTAMILVLTIGEVTVSWLAVLMILIVVLRDTIISGIRMVAANKGIVIAADIFGKIKSFFLDVGSMVLMLYVGLRGCLTNGADATIGAMPIDYIKYFGLAIVIVGVVLSIISLINYSVKAISAFKEKSREEEVKAEIEEKKDK